MTNKELKKLFEENLNKDGYYFSEWIELGVCTKEEKDLFIIWLNQLSEEKICHYLEKDFTILSVIKNQTDSMCKTSIKKTFLGIQHINVQNKNICNFIVKKNHHWFEFVKEQTVDLCILALELNKSCYTFVRIVPNPDYETTLKNLLEKKAILEALK